MSITKSQAALMSSLSGQFRSQVLAAIKAHDAVYEPLQTRPPHKVSRRTIEGRLQLTLTQYALDNALDRLRLPSPPLLPRAVEPTPPSLWLPEPLPFTPPSSSPLGPTMEEWNELGMSSACFVIALAEDRLQRASKTCRSTCPRASLRVQTSFVRRWRSRNAQRRSISRT